MKNKAQKGETEETVDMDELNEKIKKLVDAFETQIAEMKVKLDERLDSQDESVQEASEEVEAQKSELANVIKKVKSMGENKDTSKVEELEIEIKSLKARVDSNEAKGQSVDEGAEDENALSMLDSDEFKTWVKKGTGKLKMENAHPLFSVKAFKTAITLGDTELGAAAIPTYRPGISHPGVEPYGLFPLIAKRLISGDNYKAVRVALSGSHGATSTALSVNITNPSTTCTVESSLGFVAGAFIRFDTGSGIERKKLVSFDSGTHVLTFAADDLDFAMTAGAGPVTCEALAWTAEEGEKPAGFHKLETVSTDLKVMATYLEVSKVRLWVNPELKSELEQDLLTKLVRGLEWHLVYGNSSTTGQLAGFFNDDELNTFTWSTSGVTGDSRVDAVIKGSRLVLADRRVLAMNPSTWDTMTLQKSSTDGHYLQANVGLVNFTNDGAKSLYGMPVVLTSAIYGGDVLCFDPSAASEIVYNGISSVEWNYTGSQLTKNLITLLAEQMLAHAVLDPTAFCKIYLDSAPA